MAAQFKAWNVFTCSNTGIVGLNPSQGMDVCVYSVFVLCSGLVTGWSPIQGVLPTVLDKKPKWIEVSVGYVISFYHLCNMYVFTSACILCDPHCWFSNADAALLWYHLPDSYSCLNSVLLWLASLCAHVMLFPTSNHEAVNFQNIVAVSIMLVWFC
jgi:hypothetical protein